MLRRWIALDRKLHEGFLKVKEFAELWKASERTITRDLKVFEELGYKQEWKIYRRGERKVWRYPDDQKPMFESTAREVKRLPWKIVESERLD
jgi:transcriptional antiterminator